MTMMMTMSKVEKPLRGETSKTQKNKKQKTKTNKWFSCSAQTYLYLPTSHTTSSSAVHWSKMSSATSALVCGPVHRPTNCSTKVALSLLLKCTSKPSTIRSFLAFRWNFPRFDADASADAEEALLDSAWIDESRFATMSWTWDWALAVLSI